MLESCFTKSVNDLANSESGFFLCIQPPLAPALVNMNNHGGIWRKIYARLYISYDHLLHVRYCICVNEFVFLSEQCRADRGRIHKETPPEYSAPWSIF